MATADQVLNNLKTGELGEEDYRRFIVSHSAAVSETLQKLGRYLQDFEPKQSWLKRVIFSGAQLRNLTVAAPKVKPPRRFRLLHKRYLSYMKVIDEYLDLVNGMLQGKDPGAKLEKKAAELLRFLNLVSEAIARVAMVRGKT